MGMPFRIFTKTLSARISIMMVLAIAALLTVALFIMFNYSRRAIKEEAVQKAEAYDYLINGEGESENE
jgi:ABC-type bacteriocin/lantibiotic exporter with double-glycine peptidase domain